MAVTDSTDYPPTLSKEELDHILTTIKDWSIARGLAVRPSPGFVPKDSDPENVLAVTAPVTLFPSILPKPCFEEALQVQTAYNELYALISRDEKWLGHIMDELVKVDEFISNLWNIHLQVKKEGYVQDLSLGLFRSDYMIHLDPNEANAKPQIKQVEFNTMASSFGGLSSQVSLLHKYLLETKAYPQIPQLTASSLPTNQATADLASGLAAAHHGYGSARFSQRLPLCVLFVVQDSERNIFDQRHLEYAVEAKSIPVFRLPFSQTLALTRVPDESGRPLIYTPPHKPTAQYEVSVVYFRSTYSPADFPGPSAWEARLQLERSAAIKCPSILTHLAGSKKIQQVLATPDSADIRRYLDATSSERVRNTFAAIYPLDSSPVGERAKVMAKSPKESQGFVLKPQREGGGNNIYRGAIPNFLKDLGSEDKWSGHILMEIIEPPAQRNSIFREGVVKSGEVIAELGVFGACLWRNSGEVLHNQQAGYLLRTKGRESEEGGVAAGFGAIDSVALVESQGLVG